MNGRARKHDRPRINGRLEQRKPEPPDAVARWKRARILAEAEIIDPRWGSSIAQLVFFKRLTDREAAAADRWAEWSGRADRVNGWPRRQAASPLYEAGYGPSVDGETAINQGDLEFLTRHDKARKAAIGAGTLTGVMVLDDTAVLNCAVGSTTRLERLKRTLRGLMLHWRM